MNAMSASIKVALMNSLPHSVMWEYSHKLPSLKQGTALSRHWMLRHHDLGIPSLQNCTQYISFVSKLRHFLLLLQRQMVMGVILMKLQLKIQSVLNVCFLKEVMVMRLQNDSWSHLFITCAILGICAFLKLFFKFCVSTSYQMILKFLLHDIEIFTSKPTYWLLLLHPIIILGCYHA
jgi:hypothetical protein